MSPLSKRVRSLLSLKQHASSDPAVSSAGNLQTPAITPNTTRLPPEILLQIVEQLPLASLWSIRGTCRQWNTLALNEAWKAISKPTLVLDTNLHDPIDRTWSILTNSLSLVGPEQQHSPSVSPQSPKKGPLTTTRATWRVKQGNTFSPRGREVPYTYEPGFLQVLPGPHLPGPQGNITEFSMEKLSVSYGRLKEFKRIESWTSNAKRRSNFTALFSKKGGQKSKEQKGPADHRLDWSITYLVEYHMDSIGQYPPVYRLRKLTLLEVSVPISQIVCSYLPEFTDGLAGGTDGLTL
jgi:F-box-like